jgi:hypothetical protein
MTTNPIYSTQVESLPITIYNSNLEAGQAAPPMLLLI